MMGQDRLVDEYSNSGADYQGANILRFFVWAVPVILGIIAYKKSSKQFKDTDLIINLNIMGVVCMLAGNTNWLFARLAAYMMPILPILLVRCSILFESKSKLIYYMVIIALYAVYMWVYVHKDSSLIPYYFLNSNMKFY